MEKARSNVLQHFISNASHDLRTPLTTIKTLLYVLPKLSDVEKRQRHMTALETQVEHLEMLLEAMLNMSRLDKTIDFAFELIDLNTLVADVIERNEPLARQKQHDMTFTGDPTIPTVEADKVQLGRAISNIINNAVHYTPNQGMITIRTHWLDHHAVVEVQDTGLGIGTDDLPRIFERFYRVDEARGTVRGGAGLGLSIAKRIIEAHHGKIEVESILGEGSLFRIVLPVF